MKKRILILTLCFAMLFITSCSKESNTSPTPSPTATTTEETTFNLDKVYFYWNEIYYDSEVTMDRSSWWCIKNIRGYYEEEQGKGYFEDQRSLTTALSVYLNQYGMCAYSFTVVHNGEFDENKFGSMDSAIVSRTDNEIVLNALMAREDSKDEDFLVAEFDMEIIKEISHDPNVEYIYFEPPYAVTADG